MGETKIEWATHTSNWLAGCTKVSPACTHCYAETMSRRMQHLPQAPGRYAGVVDSDTGRWTGRVQYDAAALAVAFAGLLDAHRPRRVFVNSMSDTFHDDAPPESLTDLARYVRADEFGGAIASTDHVIMLLTKRPANMLAWQREHFPAGLPAWVWVGCTVEDQRRADERIPTLLSVETAGVRFLSVEPLLGPVDLCIAAFNGTDSIESLEGIGWVIVGGESGRGARPMHPEWARSVRDQCVDAGVPFFFKQWGAWAPSDAIDAHGVANPGVYEDLREDGGVPRHSWPDAAIRDKLRAAGKPAPSGALAMDTHVYLAGKHAAGRTLDGRTWDEVPRG